MKADKAVDKQKSWNRRMTKMKNRDKCNTSYEDKNCTECKEENDVVNGNENEKDNEKIQDTGTDELEGLKAELADKSRQCDEYINTAQRLAAEFDNYKKRTVKEKEALYSEAVCDVVGALLPVVDSIERAIQICNDEDDSKSIKGGIELVFKQAKDILKKLGVEEIASEGETFDPALHNAVMHVEDDSYGHNIIVEVLQKGYIFKEKVIRHSMVKVAN